MGGGIVHSGVGMGVAIIARVATIDTCHKDGAVEERGVIEGVLLVHECFLDLRRELADRLGREAAAIAVGDIVAGGPTDIVEVGDMAGRGGAGESGYLQSCGSVSFQQRTGLFQWWWNYGYFLCGRNDRKAGAAGFPENAVR